MARPLKRDLTGLRFGRLRVLGKTGSCRGQVRWKCVCDCGQICKAAGGALNRGDKKSCGCLVGDANRHHRLTHGLRHVPEYAIWNAMKQRCYNPNQPHYERYGGRGITICDEWRYDFARFYADMGPRPVGPTGKRYTIDRIDNDGPYAPGNCKWSTPKEQAQNRRPNPLWWSHRMSTPTPHE